MYRIKTTYVYLQETISCSTTISVTCIVKLSSKFELFWLLAQYDITPEISTGAVLGKVLLTRKIFQSFVLFGHLREESVVIGWVNCIVLYTCTYSLCYSSPPHSLSLFSALEK